jgi:hypothetical protein
MIRIQRFGVGGKNTFSGSLNRLFDIRPVTPAVRQGINLNACDTAVTAL